MKRIKFDKVVNFFFPSEHNLNKKVTLNDYIQRKLIINKKKTLCVLYPPWHVGDLSTAILKKRMREMNYSFLIYNFHPDILSVDYKSSEKYLKSIINTSAKDLKYYKQKYGFKNIYVIGISLGCLFAINIAIKEENVKKIILGTPGITFTDAVWEGYTTKRIKHTMIEEFKLDYNKLKKAWKDLLPIKKLHKLKNKKIFIEISESDLIIPYRLGIRFIEELKKQGVKPNIHINKYLGHYGTNIKILFWPDKYFKN